MEEHLGEREQGKKLGFFYSVSMTMIAVASIASVAYLFQSNSEMKKNIVNEKMMMAANASSLKSQTMTLQDQISREKEEKIAALEKEKFLEAKIQSLSEELDGIRKEKQAMDMEYRGLMAEKDDMSRTIQELKNQKDALDKKVKEAGREDLSIMLIKRTNDIEKKIAELKQKISKAQGEMKNITDDNTLASLKEQVKAQELDLSKQEAIKLLLDEALGRLEDIKLGIIKKVELAPIEVQTQEQAAEAKIERVAKTNNKNGQVVKVDAANKLVVINLGSAAGMSAGREVQVLRDGKEIAVLEVLVVRDGMSACVIKSSAKNIMLKPGDAAR